MSDLGWGLLMMVAGMGTVFALLVLLMGVLMGVGRLDRQPAEESATEPEELPAPATAPPAAPDGVDAATLAAIAVAVTTHAELRRRQAGPETRAHAPGSQLWASRWLAVGRSRQNIPFERR